MLISIIYIYIIYLFMEILFMKNSTLPRKKTIHSSSFFSKGRWECIDYLPTSQVEIIGKVWVAYLNNGNYCSSMTMNLQSVETGQPLGFIQRENSIQPRQVHQVIVEAYRLKEVNVAQKKFKVVFNMRADWGQQAGVDFLMSFKNPNYVVVESTGHTIALKLNVYEDIDARFFVSYTKTQPVLTVPTYRFICV